MVGGVVSRELNQVDASLYLSTRYLVRLLGVPHSGHRVNRLAVALVHHVLIKNQA